MTDTERAYYSRDRGPMLDALGWCIVLALICIAVGWLYSIGFTGEAL